MTVSTTDIANQALVKAGVKTFDNTVDSAVIAQVKKNLVNLYNLLYARGIVSWDLDSIPDHAVGSIVSELAWHIRNDFSIPDNKKVDLRVEQQQARADLQALEEVPANDEPTVINAY